MANTNVIAFDGNVTRDPENPHPAILKFAVANNYRKKTGDEWGEEANFFDVVVFGENRAAALGRILHKGTRVVVSGKIETDRWQNKDGENRSKMIVVANDVVLTSPPSEAKATGDLPVADEPPKGKEPVDDSDIPF